MEMCRYHIRSRSVSLILSVSALAWPFVVGKKKKYKESVSSLNSISILLDWYLKKKKKKKILLKFIL